MRNPVPGYIELHKNVAFDFLRQRRRKTWGYEEVLDEDGWFPAPATECPEYRMLCQERRRELTRRVDTLPIEYQRSMQTHLTGVSEKTALSLLHVSRGTYKSRVHRAKKLVLAA